MSTFILIFSTFFFSFLAIQILRPMALEIGLLDKPNARKVHKGQIPLIGGISIFLGVLASSFLFLPNTLELRMFLIASSMIVFIGILDDKYDISVRIRIVGQVIIASLMIYGVGIYIHDFGNIFGFGDVNIGYAGIIFSYLSVLVLVNAFNMIDGADGILGLQALNTFSCIAILCYFNNDLNNVSYPLIIAIALLPYLLFNLNLMPKRLSKIYMGDAGSMFIGLSVLWLLAKGTQGAEASFRPVTALWITSLPLMDMLAIVIRRIRKGNSPFKADRDHIHHLLIESGFSNKQTMLIVTFISIFFSSIGILSEIMEYSESIMFILFLVMFFIYARFLKYISAKFNIEVKDS